ncbi:MBL fold metallo-hydrolase [Paenibacillus oenotherae]|uniref:MBL fold metallo-hydrolase n=1 Tax=Paenibacillus oenotherae TaxID=1435645 RepID=A0ABS7D5S9_9BACL|nr:MBL fold metallo-hydrolase [Paenibacillus oenotherae]MBW7475289.1 MBL fold metallo-hydrolase [Paenibacillus oenotherae]
MRILKEPFLYQLTFFKNGLSVNCYIVEEEEELVLIDTAVPEAFSDIMEAASTINKPVTKIVLTHAHHDHTGGLDLIKQALPGAMVYIPDREVRLLAGDLTLNPDEPDSPIRGVIPKNIKTKADVLIKDNDRIGSLLALSTPGHTPGSMSFVDTRNQALIAGDAFQTEGCTAVAGQLCPSFPYPARGTWDNKIAIASARKLYALLPSILATGHGPMIKSPEMVMKQAIEEAELNEQ